MVIGVLSDKQSAKIIVLNLAEYQKHQWSYLKIYFLQTINKVS